MFYVQGKFNFFKSGRGGVLPPLPPFHNLPVLATRLLRLIQANEVFKGNIEASLSMTIYGYLTVSGEEERQYRPMENLKLELL